MIPDDIYMGIVYDSMRLLGEKYDDFYLNIKPKAGYREIIHGPVFTTYGELTSGLEIEYSKLDNIRLEFYKEELFASSPIVFLQANDSVVAHSGDITSLIYQDLGAKGFVTDGNVRDIDIINKMGFPTFCADENPIDALDYWALTKYQIPIEISGVKISPNDYSFASKDGVIVVRKEIFEKFKDNAIEQLKRENSIRNEIKNRKSSYQNLVKEHGRW